MAEIIFCGTPKRASTVQRRVRSTESCALVRSIKHTYCGIRFFRASSCNRRITNIISVAQWFARKPLCSSGRIATRSQYSLKRRAMMFSSILPACAAGVCCRRDAPVVAALCPTLLFVEYHDDGIFPLLLRHHAPLPNTNGDIEQSPTQGGITVEGNLKQLNGDSVWSDSLSVRQRASGVCHLLHRRLNS